MPKKPKEPDCGCIAEKSGCVFPETLAELEKSKALSIELATALQGMLSASYASDEKTYFDAPHNARAALGKARAAGILPPNLKVPE